MREMHAGGLVVRLFAEPASPVVTAQQVRAALARYRMPVSVEKALQDAVESALRAEGLKFTREVTRGADRIDFVVGSVGVELKVKGAVGEVIRQLSRYAAWPEITELLLVTTQHNHVVVPDQICRKPVVIHLVRGTF